MCHGGFMGTLHANSLNRLETMVLMNQIELPLHALWPRFPWPLTWLCRCRHIGRRCLMTWIIEIAPLSDSKQSILAAGHVCHAIGIR